MIALTNSLMSVDDFLVWAETKPERWELYDGVPIAMSPERVRHGEAKGAAFLALRGAIRAAGVPCRALPDSAGVRINERTCYQPDALVYCGERLPGDAIEVPNPVIVVEVTSPGSVRKDTGLKLAGYFFVPSMRHYLIVDPVERVMIHHQRGEDERIQTRIARDGMIALDPLTVGVNDLFGPP